MVTEKNGMDKRGRADKGRQVKTLAEQGETTTTTTTTTTKTKLTDNSPPPRSPKQLKKVRSTKKQNL